MLNHKDFAYTLDRRPHNGNNDTYKNYKRNKTIIHIHHDARIIPSDIFIIPTKRHSLDFLQKTKKKREERSIKKDFPRKSL